MIERTPLFKRNTIIKLTRLLNMQYKPRELADEIGINADTVYRGYLPAGAPHTRDRAGNIWIEGTSFREWAMTHTGARKRTKHPLTESEAWCFKCNRPVTIINPRVKPSNRYLALIQGTCQQCGARVNRGISAKRGEELYPKKKPRANA